MFFSWFQWREEEEAGSGAAGGGDPPRLLLPPPPPPPLVGLVARGRTSETRARAGGGAAAGGSAAGRRWRISINSTSTVSSNGCWKVSGTREGGGLGRWGSGPREAGLSRKPLGSGARTQRLRVWGPGLFIAPCPCFHILIMWSPRTYQCDLAGRRPSAMRARLLHFPPPSKPSFLQLSFPLNVHLHTDPARVTVWLSAHQIVVLRTGGRCCVQRAPAR